MIYDILITGIFGLALTGIIIKVFIEFYGNDNNCLI